LSYFKNIIKTNFVNFMFLADNIRHYEGCVHHRLTCLKGGGFCEAKDGGIVTDGASPIPTEFVEFYWTDGASPIPTMVVLTKASLA
jgi:hypothetical protein